MPARGNPSGLPNIGRTLVSARSLDEYVAMFDLASADLNGTILDCPGGAASFAAEARAHGGSVVAVDPIYAASPRWLVEHAVDEAVRGNRHTGSSVDSFVWTFFADLADHLRRRTTSARLFGDDLLANPSTYIAGSLPQLPFSDASFDLVLSSHLLFLYADRLTPDFHVAAACEMVRVARREVRVFPLISDNGIDVSPTVDAVCEAVATLGCTSTIKPSSYEFQKGGDQMLVIDVDGSGR
jgi:hypothetical protein